MGSDNRTGEALAPRTPVSQPLEGSSGSGNSQATSSNTGSAMFDSASNVMITGGQFTASQGNHANVTININDSRTPRTSGALRGPRAQNVAPSPNPNPNRNRRRRRPNRPEANMIRPVQRSNEMYERHLSPKGRGFPLWIPQPNIRLPIPYRAKGVCIGDVGIVTAFGGFDFLFNICRTRDDPVNPEELPDNFTPIYPPLNPTDVREFREFSSGSYLASSSIVESQSGEQTPGLTFESSASEGAILTMPDGAFQEELGNLSKFRDYVAVHAANWYKFVNGPRGREAQNGDVRVVVGCDKTTSWGMATFANTSSAQQSNFRLKFRPLRGQEQSQHNAGTSYAWEHSGVAEVRVGPEPGENEELGETPTRQLRNQCLFMRTLSVTLSKSVWAETFPGTVLANNQEGSQPEYHGQYLRPPNPNSSSSLSDLARSIQGRLYPGLSESEIKEDENDDAGSAGPSDTHDSDDIRPEEPFVGFVDKLYHMTNDPVLTNCLKWTNSGTSFIISITNVQMFAELLGPLFRHNNFSSFVRQLKMYGFQVISRISPPNQDQTWEFSHPKFIRGRPDLLHEIKRKALELHLNPAMKDEKELPGDLLQAPAQSNALQNETTSNPSKIISKYLLDQVPDAKIALTHDRDWSHVAMTGLTPSELIKEINFMNDITVDSESGVVFLEPKNNISLLTLEEISIIDQIEGDHITLELYLFGSSENHSTLLRDLINQLRSDYIPFCDQYTMPAKESPNFLMGHPKRLLSLDDLLDIRLANFQSLMEHHYIHYLRGQLSALPPDDPDKGIWLLRLADVLSRRYWQLDQKDNLEEAIWYYEEALSLLPQTHYHFLEAILGFCSCVYQRFQLLGHLDDLKKLLEHLHTEHNLNVESLLAPVKARLQPRTQKPTSRWVATKTSDHQSHPSPSSVYLPKPTGSTISAIHPKPSFTRDVVTRKQQYTDQQPDTDTISSNIGGAHPFAELPPHLFALIIGINEYESPRIPNLVGAVPDADAMRDYLQKHLGVPSSQIWNLRDSEATRAAIIDGIESFSLNDEIKEGDPILIYYAGIGGSADTPKGWEVGSTDQIELLVPYDHSSPLETLVDGNHKLGIPDRTLGALLSQLAMEKGDNITVIFDCCHSGSGTRNYKDPTELVRGIDVGNVPSNLDQDIWSVVESSRDVKCGSVIQSGVARKGLRSARKGLRSHVLLAACRHHEFAYERTGRGVFTVALLKTLVDIGIDKLTYVTLFDLMPPLSGGQKPQCEGVFRERLIFNGKASGKRIKSKGETAYVLPDAGEADGITAGAGFEVYQDQNFGRLLNTVIARELSASSTTLYPNESISALESRAGTEGQVRIHVADENLKNLVKKIDPNQRIIQPVERDHGAEFGIALENGKVVFNIFDTDVTKYGLTRMPYVLEPTLEAITPVIRAAVHFYWYRRRTLRTGRGLAEEVEIELTELTLERIDCDEELKPVVVYAPTASGDWKGGRDFNVHTETVYGWRIINNCDVPLYPVLFYFDSSDWSITLYYEPPVGRGIVEPPLKGKGYLTVGYGDSGLIPHTFFLREGQNVDVGILKLFLSRKPVDLSHVAQSSPFVLESIRDVAQTVVPQLADLPLPWDTIEIPVVQRRADK